MITIFGTYRSRAARALWCAGEAGIDVRLEPVIQAYRVARGTDPGGAMRTDEPAYLAINPMGQIPAMRDGDLILTESMAITLYIARQATTDIGPRDAAEDARMQNWAFHAATAIEAAALGILIAVEDGEGGPERLAALAADLARPFARLEALLARQPWLMGDRFTVADIVTAECVRYARPHPTLLGEHPALAGWLDRCQARPAFREMWAARAAETP
jgi:glutathione S-transferase